MIEIQDHGPVRQIRLANPPANALSPALVAALHAAVTAAPGEGARAIVLSGSPGMFSAGLDVPLLLHLDRAGIAAAWRAVYDLLHALAASPIPIAAALTGHAPAGGTVLALFCDYRILAAGTFKLGLNEVRVGLQLPPVIFAALRRQVGPRQAERLAVGGLLLGAEEAERVGLVEEVVAAERVVERAVEWCQGLVALAPQAMALTRHAARADLVRLFADDLAGERDAVLDNWWSPEAQTALRALVAKLAAKKG